MSFEVFGGGDEFDVEELYKRGWESDADGIKWWRKGEEEDIFTLDEAIDAYENWLLSQFDY